MKLKFSHLRINSQDAIVFIHRGHNIKECLSLRLILLEWNYKSKDLLDRKSYLLYELFSVKLEILCQKLIST